MFDHTTHRKRGLAAASLTALLALGACSPALAANTPHQAFVKVKAEEDGFTVPPPSADVPIGTYDAATRGFDGNVTECIDEGPPAPAICKYGRLPATTTVNAVNARVVIGWENATSRVTVRANGRSKSSTAPRGSLTIDVGRSRSVDWSITSGTGSFRDTLEVKRPTMIGAGAFTVKALPIGVVYEPPQDPARRNKVSYRRVSSLSTRIGATLERSTSTATPIATTLGTFNTVVKAAAQAAKSVPSLAAAGAAMSAIEGVIGNTSSNVTTSQATGSSTEIEMSVNDAITCSTASHAGLGRGDLIVYLKNAYVAWVDNGYRTYLALLGSDDASCAYVDSILNGTSALDPETARTLLEVDPFVPNPMLGIPKPGTNPPPGIVPPADRYVLARRIDLDPLTAIEPVLHTHLESEMRTWERSYVTSTVRTDTFTAGFLSFVGLTGDSQTVTTSVTMSNSTSTTSGTTVLTEATLSTLDEGRGTTLDVYYDKAFGTLVYHDPRTVQGG